MKRLLKIFLFLSLFATGAYYLYTINSDFNTYVSDLIHTYHKNDQVDTLALSEPHNKLKRSSRKKIPKGIKADMFHALDRYARMTPKQYEKDITTLAQYLIIPANSDLEKVRVLFTWVATHIKYDDKAFNSGNFPDYTPEYVLLNKRAVCEGYSNILKALCLTAGLEAEKVIGYSKGYSYNVGDKFTETNHAWNVIKVENKWRLFDATWASGSGTNKNGKLFSKSEFDPFWFNVNPKAFIFTHLPEETKWQLTGGTLTLGQYEVLPYLSIDFFKLGFDPDKIYTEAVSGNVKEFAETYSLEFPTNASQLPYAKSVSRNDEITFQIQSEYAEEIALIDGTTWHYFLKEDNTFTLSHQPKGKKLEVCVKINWYEKNFLTIIKYIVKGKEGITGAS